MSPPAVPGPSIRALEVFASVARTGSLQETARALDMSPPAASQQLRKLEAALGHALIEHGRRPLEPTPAGHAYLVHVRAALNQLREGAVAVSLEDFTRLSRLRIGVIDDLDGEVTPSLATALADNLPRCELSLLTVPSHQILSELIAGTLDVGIAARSTEHGNALMEVPLLRDPFVVAVPRGFLRAAPNALTRLDALPFLRYSERQLIGRQISGDLAWRKIVLRGRISVDSNPVLFGLIAAGQGWAITTPLGFSRARRFHDRVDLHPLPFTGFSRVISLYRGKGWRDDVPDIIAGTVRDSLRTRVVGPLLATHPWLAEALFVME